VGFNNLNTKRHSGFLGSGIYLILALLRVTLKPFTTTLGCASRTRPDWACSFRAIPRDETVPACLESKTRLLADFAKFPVALVVIEADAVASFGVNDADSDREIRAAVIVIVCPGRAESVDRAGQAGAFRHVHETFAAFIVEQEKPSAAAPPIAT
jgi:hypothetical protein